MKFFILGIMSLSALSASAYAGSFSVKCVYSIPNGGPYELNISKNSSGKVDFEEPRMAGTSDAESVINNDGDAVFLHDSILGEGIHLFELVTLPAGFECMDKFVGSVRLLSRHPKDLRVPRRSKDTFELSCSSNRS